MDLLVQINSSSLMDWYSEWKSQPKDTPVAELPYVGVDQLLRALGVPAAKQGSIIATLTEDDLPELRRVALPAYSSHVPEHFASQLVAFDYQSQAGAVSCHSESASYSH